jgi:hypothetical protein
MIRHQKNKFAPVLKHHTVKGSKGHVQSQSVIVTLQLMVGRSVGRSVSQSVLALSPSGTRDHISVVVLYVMGRLPCREDRSFTQQVTVLVCVKQYVHFEVFF